MELSVLGLVDLPVHIKVVNSQDEISLEWKREYLMVYEFWRLMLDIF